ncbi:MAG: long-chain fatty acid--CoA ligase [Candidatus Heimdallarchaeota archaeon]|nr:long-chain fatty acid--CoA ligase [Candidatus Heimdallarchaeota archaeon]
MIEKIPTPWIESLPEGRLFTMEYEDIGPYEFLKRRVEQETNDTMLIFPIGKSMSYAEVMQEVERMAAHFKHLGLEKGDRIAILTPNTPHYIVTFFAVLSIGCIIVQANPLYTEHELTLQLKNSGARAIISLTMFQEKVNSIIESRSTKLEFAVYGQLQTYLPSYKRFLGRMLKKSIFDPENRSYDAPFIEEEYSYFYDEFIFNDYEFKEEEIDIYKDIAVFQYTGGTTGVSKGAMLSHRNLSVNAQQARQVLHMVPEKKGSILTVLPLFHVFGMTTCLGLSIQLGIPLILNVASPPDFRDILKWIQKYKITFFPGVPAMMAAIANHPMVEKADFSSLIAVISGGAPLPIEVARKFHQVTGAYLVEGYGLSETSPVTHVNPIGLPVEEMVEGSIGLPTADTLIKIVDTEDYAKILEVGEVGELCIKGPQVMQGYYGMPNETKNALKEDGWLRTGDIAKMDEQGYTYIVDRKKDIIIVSGYNVVPREVEEVLYKHPAILEAAVAGITHPEKGEIVAAWVVLKKEQQATEDEVITFCKQYLAPYKVPKQIVFKNTLPKSMVGKILRRKLQEETR